MKVRVLLADDHQIFAESLRLMLEMDTDIEVLGIANNGLDLFKLAKELKPDIVCMDVGMPGMNGIETTRRLTASCPELRAVSDRR